MYEQSLRNDCDLGFRAIVLRVIIMARIETVIRIIITEMIIIMIIIRPLGLGLACLVLLELGIRPFTRPKT